MKEDMAKFDVTIYYHTSVTVRVDAKNQDDAVQAAYTEVMDEKYDTQILDNLSEDDTPDVEEVN